MGAKLNLITYTKSNQVVLDSLLELLAISNQQTAQLLALMQISLVYLKMRLRAVTYLMNTSPQLKRHSMNVQNEDQRLVTQLWECDMF